MAKSVPVYTFTGECESEMRGETWYIYLKSSGTLTFGHGKTNVEACVVGGGAGGTSQHVPPFGDRGMPGGRGGAVVNRSGLSVSQGTGYSIVIGAGGGASLPGESTVALGITAAGGTVVTQVAAGAGGENGTDGAYAFDDSTLSRYGGGGGSGGVAFGAGGSGGAGGGGKGAGGGMAAVSGANAAAGAANTGGGGGGAGSCYYDDDSRYNGIGGAAAGGGSGIVILRGTEDDLLPVTFNGVQLSGITFNGQAVVGLIFGGIRVFMRRMRRMKKIFGRCAAHGV